MLRKKLADEEAKKAAFAEMTASAELIANLNATVLAMHKFDPEDPGAWLAALQGFIVEGVLKDPSLNDQEPSIENMRVALAGIGGLSLLGLMYLKEKE